jgi:N-acetylmuramic acid 6-phosphate etherase
MSRNETLFNELRQLETEQRNPATMAIDLADAAEIVRLIHEEDRLVAASVAERSTQIASGIETVHEALSRGGRLIYAGAGTSGRLGVIDAAECPPTFGTEPWQVQALMAGGEAAMFVAQEGAEDREELGRSDLEALNVNASDVVCGLAASGRTPYVLGALKHAKSVGAATIMVCCVSAHRVKDEGSIDIMIDVPVGQEAIMGSTRMKSATAQKMVCNMLTTGAMIRSGKVYENVMVDLKLTNLKLVERARRIIMMFTHFDYDRCAALLDEADGHVKTALVMGLSGLGKDQARALLAEHGGFIRSALNAIGRS